MKSIICGICSGMTVYVMAWFIQPWIQNRQQVETRPSPQSSFDRTEVPTKFNEAGESVWQAVEEYAELIQNTIDSADTGADSSSTDIADAEPVVPLVYQVREAEPSSPPSMTSVALVAENDIDNEPAVIVIEDSAEVAASQEPQSVEIVSQAVVDTNPISISVPQDLVAAQSSTKGNPAGNLERSGSNSGAIVSVGVPSVSASQVIEATVVAPPSSVESPRRSRWSASRRAASASESQSIDQTPASTPLEQATQSLSRLAKKLGKH